MAHQRRPSFQYQIENKESTLTAHAGMGLISRQPQSMATLDQDATFIENCHKGSHFNCKSEHSYETFNTYWSERDVMVRGQVS